MIALDIVDLRVDAVEQCHDSYLFHCVLIKTESRCPCCQMLSSSVRYYYYRTIQDLPINGKSVFLKIQCRKFNCKNKQCEQNFLDKKSIS